MSNWISVKDRLPCEKDKILMIDECGGRFSGNGSVLIHNIKLIDLDGIHHTRYTYWMPYPKLPN